MTDLPGPLSGIRVLDLTRGVAGPAATLLMGFMGADVIRVSTASRGHPDGTNPAGNNLHLGKKSIRLNLTKPNGLEIAKRIVAVSDVVLENQRPRAVEKLGLGYEALKQINPRIIGISLSTSGYGGTEELVGLACNFVSLAGLGEVSGYPGGAPGEYVNWPDYMSGIWATFGLLYALHHREQTGEGQFIDLSCTEALSSLVGDTLVGAAMPGQTSPTRVGNRDAWMAPHNSYRCADLTPADGAQWLSIAVATDAEWSALTEVMARPDLCTDPRFATGLARWHHQDELDAEITAWTSQHSKTDLTHRLQAAGVAAFPSMSGKDLYEDPHMKAQQRWVHVDRPDVGAIDMLDAPWRFSETPAFVRAPWPLVGEHEDYVLREVLGLGDTEIEVLTGSGDVLA